MVVTKDFVGRTLNSFLIPELSFAGVRPTLDKQRGILYCVKYSPVWQPVTIIGINIADGSFNRCIVTEEHAIEALLYQESTDLLWLAFGQSYGNADSGTRLFAWPPSGTKSVADVFLRKKSLTRRMLLACDEEGRGDLFALGDAGTFCGRIRLAARPEGVDPQQPQDARVAAHDLRINPIKEAAILGRRLYVIHSASTCITVYDWRNGKRLQIIRASGCSHRLSVSGIGALFYSDMSTHEKAAVSVVSLSEF